MFTYTKIRPRLTFFCFKILSKKLIPCVIDAGINKSFLPDDFYDEDQNESSIRRACSLSDLSMGKGKNLTAFL